MLMAGALDGDVREASPREGHEMHTLVRRIDRQVGAELALERGNQLVALLPVQHAHAANMRGEVAFVHEGGDHGLA